jgi:hypothetical protein
MLITRMKRARLLLAVAGAFACVQAADAQSLRFFGNGSSAPDLDRVKISIDAPERPADIGSTDFTIEMWIKGNLAANSGTVNGCNSADYDGWVRGNIFFDRDRYSSAPGFGISLGNGRVAFAVVNSARNVGTVCSPGSVLDGQWHHIAVTRTLTGTMRIFVDGTPAGTFNGPSGNISYPDGANDSGCPVRPCVESNPFIVLGAEKHDAGTPYPAFDGFMDELRLSTTIRYTGTFTPSSTPFSMDAQTAALYHFDDGSGTTLSDANNNQSPGVLRVGGNPAGPIWSTDTPFNATSPGTIQLQSATTSTMETTGGSTLTLNVTRSGGTAGAASVAFATSDATALAGSDYTTTTNTLQWADGIGGNRSIQIPILDDATFESPETFAVTLSNATGATLGNPMLTTVTINDNDASPQPGALQFSAVSYSTPEAAGTVTITVNRTGGNDGAVSVSYAATGGTATAGTDYTLPAGTLSWASGDVAAKTFTVAINADGALEPNETVQLTLSGPTNGAVIGSIGSATLTIVDDDSNLQFSAPAYAVSEAGPAVSLSVTRTGSAAIQASVSYATANGTASAPGDFAASNGVLNWPAGDGAAKTITVPITNDSAFESNETFTVTLGSPSGANLISPSTATVTINDNDDPVPGVLQFSVPEYFAIEGDGTVTISVTRSGGTDGAVSVQYASGGGSADPANDYIPVSGTLTWTNGDAAAKTFIVSLADDANVEPSETINLTLSAPTGGATIGTTGTSIVNVADDDSTLQFSPASYTVSEPGTVTLTVTRTGSAAQAASVGFATANGSADANDFTPTTGTLNWPAGDSTSRTISVLITDDPTSEGSETFVVELSGASGATLGAAINAAVTIDASDQAIPGELRFSSPSYTVSEDGGDFIVSVTRSAGSAGAVTVDYATSNGTATFPDDYTPVSGTLTFGNGVTSQTFVVPIVNDAAQEPVETLNLTLSAPMGGASIGTPGTAVINISANDAPPPSAGALRFAVASSTVSEAGGSVSIRVRRVGGSAGIATVQYQFANVTATAGADYVAQPVQLRWGNGNANDQFVTVPITNDTAFEANETFTVTLTNPTVAILGSPATHTVTITDNDVAQRGTLQFATAAPTVTESAGTVALAIDRIGGADGAVSVSFATSNGTATSPSDFTGVTQTVTWADGDSAQKMVSVPITNDSANEPAETFTAAIATATGGATLGTPVSLTITVNDDDAPAPPPQESGGGGGGSLGYGGLLLGVLVAFRRRSIWVAARSSF